jgi:putative transposase
MIIRKKPKNNPPKHYKTRAKPVSRNKMIMISRRTSEGRFFIKPGKKNNQILEFCLAAAALKHGLKVHNYSFMPNHYHLLLTDVYGNYPCFLADMNRNIAKCFNVSLERFDSLWDSSKPSVVRLPNHVVPVKAKLMYIFMNPVKALLSPRARKYLGANSLPGDLAGHSKVIKRPKVYFKKESKLPKKVRLKIEMPEALLKFTDKKSMVKLLKEDLRKAEDDIIAKYGKNTFMSKRELLKTDPESKPKKDIERFKLNPKVAGVVSELIAAEKSKLVDFLRAYEKSFQRWQLGERDVYFPAGTYEMARLHKVRVRQFDSS